MAEATLNGTIVNDGGFPCEGRFQYGTTLALGTFTPWQGGALRTGDTFSQHIMGLAGRTVYYFRAEARNALGSATPGSILSFITTKTLVAAVDILNPDNITEYRARLRGIVADQGDRPGAVRFNYGTTAAYGMVTPWQEGFGTGDEFQAVVSGLSPGMAYHARAEFRCSPSVFSKDLSFSTLAELGGLALVDDELMHLLEAP